MQSTGPSDSGDYMGYMIHIYIYRGSIGIMEKKMETTIMGLHEPLSYLLVSPLISPG